MELKKHLRPGTIIEGEVKSITDFGIFVGIEEGIDGLVHISDFSWTKRVNHPSEMFKKVIKFEPLCWVLISKTKDSLGIKQLIKILGKISKVPIQLISARCKSC